MRGLRPISPRTTICTLFGSAESVELDPVDLGVLRRESYWDGRDSKAIVNIVEMKAVIVKIACSILFVDSQTYEVLSSLTLRTMGDGESRLSRRLDFKTR